MSFLYTGKLHLSAWATLPVRIPFSLTPLILLTRLTKITALPVFWFTSVSLGGFGFTPLQISIFLGISGGSQALWLLLIFPRIQRRFGTGGVLRACAYAWPFMLAANPLYNYLLRQDQANFLTAFWVLAPTTMVLGSGVAMSYTCVQLALNDISPSAGTLGTLNAVALTLSSGIRAVAPAATTGIYAAGVRAQILSGYLGWVVLVLLSIGLTVAVMWLPEKAEGRLRKTKQADRDA
jgi:hypothetical protein